MKPIVTVPVRDVNREAIEMYGAPIVSAVIVNRNGAEHLRICLPSLLAQSQRRIEIIVVDNDSSDTSEAVTKSFGVTWLPLRENIGLAPALNRGAAVARGGFLLFVNNDMRFDGDFVGRLVEAINSDDSIFAADGKQYNWDGSAPGHMATRLAGARSKEATSIELVPGLNIYQWPAAQMVPVFMASAASMLVRKSYFEKLGGMDDDIPMGYEDADVCWRAWVRGWKTVYVPNAICWHRVGSSCRSAEGSLFLFVGVLKGRLAFATKLLPMRYALVTWMISVAGLGKDIFRLKWRFAWARIRVLAEFAWRLPDFLRTKHELYQGSSVTVRPQLDRMLQLGRQGTIEAQWPNVAVGSAPK